MKDEAEDPLLANTWRFLLPSAIGAIIFLLPIKIDEKYTIPLGVLIDLANASLGDSKVWLVLAILSVSGIATPPGKLAALTPDSLAPPLSSPARCSGAMGHFTRNRRGQRMAHLFQNRAGMDLACVYGRCRPV